MQKKKITILSLILLVLIVIIFALLDARRFHPPKFEENAKVFENEPEGLITVNDDYIFSINGNPTLSNNYLNINLYSLTSENIYIKVRIMQGDKIIGQSGLLKSHEYLDKLYVSSINKSKGIQYVIMGYEKDTYYSMGEVTLNIKM